MRYTIGWGVAVTILVNMVVNMGLNIAFVVPMVRYGYRAPHAGLALATTLSAFLNAGLLYRGLRRSQVYRPGGDWGALVFLGRKK